VECLDPQALRQARLAISMPSINTKVWAAIYLVMHFPLKYSVIKFAMLAGMSTPHRNARRPAGQGTLL
jgi:hypothetical protein